MAKKKMSGAAKKAWVAKRITSKEAGKIMQKKIARFKAIEKNRGS